MLFIILKIRSADSPLQAIREIFFSHFKMIDEDSYSRLKVKTIFRAYESNDKFLLIYEKKAISFYLS